MGFDERRVNLLKRMSQEHEAAVGNAVAASGGISGVASAVGASSGGGVSGGGGGGIQEPPSKIARHDHEEETEPPGPVTPQIPHASLFMSHQEKIPTGSPVQNVLTPIPHELTVNARQELRKCFAFAVVSPRLCQIF